MPIPEITSSRADGSLIFLSANDILFWGEINDPWYSAHNFADNATEMGTKVSDGLFFNDDPVRVVGCLERLQFCNPNLPRESGCTNLTGRWPAFKEAEKLWQSESQTAIFDWSALGMKGSIHDLPQWLGELSLLASQMLTGSYQPHLPDNQWELEMEYWFQSSLASYQRGLVNLAGGPVDPSLRKFCTGPSNPSEQLGCSSQKIRSNTCTSFSVLGLVTLTSLCGSIILISFFLPQLTQKWSLKRNPYKSLEWTVNETFQLQRLAHEAVGAGKWQRTDGYCPTTEHMESLALLDVTDHSHPILKKVDSRPVDVSDAGDKMEIEKIDDDIDHH
jgi:hypothetical protein